jgi:hypothetical protein
MGEWLLSRRDRVIVARHEVPGSRCREPRPGGTVEVWWIAAENLVLLASNLSRDPFNRPAGRGNFPHGSRHLSVFSVISESSSSSSFVLGRHLGGRSEAPAACFLDASFASVRRTTQAPPQLPGSGLWKPGRTPVSAIAGTPDNPPSSAP